MPKKPIFSDDEIVDFSTNERKMIINEDLDFIDLCSRSI